MEEKSALHKREQEVVHRRPAGSLVPVDPRGHGLHARAVDGQTSRPREADQGKDDGLHPQGPAAQAGTGRPLALRGPGPRVRPHDAGADEGVDDEAVHGQEHAHDGRRHAFVRLWVGPLEAGLRCQRHDGDEHELCQDC